MQSFRVQLSRAALGLMLAGGLGACSQTVVVEAEFPDPLVEPLPLTVGLRYPQQFTEYTYHEDLPQDVSWTFELGEANRQLFDKVFAAMFDGVVALDDESVPPGVDLIVEPQVDALEFSTPSQSRTDQYAVWIRYTLDVTRPDGETITQWPVAAYGQSDSRAMQSTKSMARAAVRAMRDAAATITAGLADQARVESLLAGPAEPTEVAGEEVINAEAAEEAEALATEERNDAT